MLVWQSYGQPAALIGPMYTAVTGTAVVFSGTGVVSTTGLGIWNPSTSTTRMTIVRASLQPTGTGAGANSGAWGIGKVIGTSTPGVISGIGGSAIYSPGVKGFAVPVATVIGTCSILGGTAGNGVGSLNWAVLCGSISGTNAGGGGAPPPADLHGECVLMPGESAFIVSGAAETALGSLTWIETPIYVGGL